MYNYRAYGLQFSCPFPFDELQEVNPGATDVLIKVTHVRRDQIPDHASNATPWRSIDRKSACLTLPRICQIFVNNGKTIDVQLADEIDFALVRPLILGGILGACLYQRGLIVMHASAVAIGGRAVAVSGPSGAGKSTLAASLTQRGGEVVTDDALGIELASDHVLATPAFHGVKVDPTVLEALGCSSDAATLIVGSSRTRRWYKRGVFAATTPVLSAIVALPDFSKATSHSSDPTLQPMKTADAFAFLLGQVLPTRFGFPADKLAFLQLAELVRRVPTYLLSRKPDIGNLHVPAMAIEKLLSDQPTSR